MLNLFIQKSSWRNSHKYSEWRKRVIDHYGQRCAITGQTDQLVVHHLYSAHHFPHLRFNPKTGILITSAIHIAFHAWNGGTNAPCTVADWNRFIKNYYPHCQNAIVKFSLLRYNLKAFLLAVVITSWVTAAVLHKVLG